MVEPRAQQIQNVFLEHVRENRIPLTMFLVNGVKLQGYVTGFDNFSVLLTRDQSSQLVYKHAISAVHPLPSISLPGAEDAAGRVSS